MRLFGKINSEYIGKMELSETYWILLTTSGFAFLGLITRYALKSKCDRVECGCIKIHRNTEQETDVEALPPSPSGQMIAQERRERITL
jgi:hypothetical protein